MEIILALSMFLWLAGFAVPVPCFALACRAWFVIRGTTATGPWRRRLSHFALAAFAAGMGLWAYVAVQQYRGADFYDSTTSHIGAAGSAVLIVLSAFGERKIRIWLILGAIGLLLFFVVSTGEVAI
jgi:hypothetical protein